MSAFRLRLAHLKGGALFRLSSRTAHTYRCTLLAMAGSVSRIRVGWVFLFLSIILKAASAIATFVSQLIGAYAASHCTVGLLKILCFVSEALRELAVVYCYLRIS